MLFFRRERCRRGVALSFKEQRFGKCLCPRELWGEVGVRATTMWVRFASGDTLLWDPIDGAGGTE
jgi:hypothetical protein